MKTKISSLIVLMFFSLGFSLQDLKANNIRIYDASAPTDRTKSGQTELLSTVEDANIPADHYAIQFNLMWDNSWKSSNPRNWDAAWIFAKYNLGGTGWNHVWLNDTGAAVHPAARHGVAIDAGGFARGAKSGEKYGSFSPIEYSIVPGYSYIPEAKKSLPVGIFLYRATNGYGTVQFEKMRLYWNYKDQGLAADDPVTVQVFAIEMVYVPGGEFRLGTGGTEGNSFRVSYITNPTTMNQADPFVMRTEDSLCIVPYPTTNVGTHPDDSAQLSYATYTATIAQINNRTAPRIRVPFDFPKGTAAYYMMKYEITQEAYVDYLNTLNVQQQGMRTVDRALTSADIKTGLSYNSTTYRNGVTLFDLSGAGLFVCNLTGLLQEMDDVNQVSDGQNIAMNYINVQDWLSYLAWSGLRPFTEFEFEKACRGNQLPVKEEFAWGNTTLALCLNPSVAANVFRPAFDNEKPLPLTVDAMTNFNGYPNNAPVRVGSFADSATSRADAGASYWGIMELSGNLWERCMSAVHENTTMVFKGTHGYGQLDPLSGDAPFALSWPMNYAANSYGLKGGGLGHAVAQTVAARVSDRTTYMPHNANARAYYIGGRGVRTAVTQK